MQDRGSLPQSRQAWLAPGEGAVPPPSRSTLRTATMSPSPYERSASPNGFNSPPAPMLPPSTPCDGDAYRLELESTRLAHQAENEFRRSPRNASPYKSPYRSGSPTRQARSASPRKPRSPSKIATLPILEPGHDFVVTKDDLSTGAAYVYYDMYC